MDGRFLRGVRMPHTSILTALAILLLAGPVGAAGPDDARIAVVVAEEALVRSGPHSNYYPFGRLPAGSPVSVIGEKENWARVRATGPAFRDFYGYVRHRDADTGPLRLDEDGRTAWTVGKVDVLAPNMNSGGRPGDSWKLLVRVDPDQRLTVLETLRLERTIVHKVALPATATGWMNRAHVRFAEDHELERLAALLAGAPAAASAAPAKTAERVAVQRIPEVLARVEDPVPTVTPTPDGPPLRPAPWPTRAATEPVTEETARPTEIAATPPAETTMATPPASEPARRDDRTELIELEDLEQAYERLRREPIETAEVMPLRNLYLRLAETSAAKPGIARYAEARAEQLLIWSQLQEKRQEIDRIRQRLRETSSEAEAARIAIERDSHYVAVGTVAASTIYNGHRLPMLLRLQDPGTNRTIAYLRPDGEHDLLGLIGQLIGIVGTRDYDGGLRLNIIRPERVDVLTGDRATP